MKRIVSILLVLLLVAATAVVSSLVTARQMERAYEAEADTAPVVYKMKRILSMLDHYYINEYDEAAVQAAAADGAAAAMIDAISDEWSYYISADEMRSYEETMTNSYVGIGVTIVEVEDGVEITGVYPGGPAEEAGILVGDICIAVEGESIAGNGTEGTQVLVMGEEGTFVRMRFRRGDEEYEVSVERRLVLMDVADLMMLEDGIAVITILNFDERCAEQTLACIDEALEQGAKALLFDVRFNPGGYKEELNTVLDRLLPRGVLFRSVDYLGDELVDRSDARCLELPMAVLINEESWSAAEFFAAALQEYDWAEIVGMQTSGKGNFQYTLDLGDGSAINLSCGRYYTPNGVSLTGVGVTPDVVVDLDDEDYALLYTGELDPAEDEQLQAAVTVLRDILDEIP